MHVEPHFDDHPVNIDEVELSKNRLYRAVIGENSTEYYLDQFAQLDQQWHTRGSWNWAALFMTFPWLVYRKMWGRAFLYLLLPYTYVVALAFALVLMPRYALFAALIFAFGYLLFLFGLVPRIANRQYHAFCLRKLKRARKISPQLQDQAAWLTKRGGTTNLGIVAFVSVLAFVAVTGSFETVSLIGKRSASLQTVYWKTQNATQWVSNYYSFRQLLPETLEETGDADPIPEEVSDIDYDAHSGVITATLASHGLEGKRLQWTPSTPYYLELQWKCSSPDIPDYYLPPQCQAHPRKTKLQ